jgi:hypothetical protein
VTTSTFNIRRQTRRIVLPCVVTAALMAPAAAWAMQEASYGPTEETPAPATRPDLPPANPSDVAESVATLPDLAPANPMDVGRSVATQSHPAPAFSSDIGRPGAPITLLPDQTRFSPNRIFQSPEPSTLPDLAPADPTQITPEAIPAPATLPDLAPANPMPVAPVGQTAGDDGFDFGDAGIGVAIVAGACALLAAVAAFFAGRRRRLGASHS